MLPGMRSVLGWAAGQIPTVAILSVLVGLGLWGAVNDWKIPGLGASTAKGEKEQAARETVQVISDVPEFSGPGARPLASMRIEFPSPEAVHKAGVQVEAQKLRGHGIAREQQRIAYRTCQRHCCDGPGHCHLHGHFGNRE